MNLIKKLIPLFSLLIFLNNYVSAQSWNLTPARTATPTRTYTPTSTSTPSPSKTLNKFVSVEFDKIKSAYSKTNEKNYNSFNVEGSGTAELIFNSDGGKYTTKRLSFKSIILEFYSEFTPPSIGSNPSASIAMTKPIMEPDKISQGLLVKESYWFQGCHFMARLFNAKKLAVPFFIWNDEYKVNWFTMDEKASVLTVYLVRTIDLSVSESKKVLPDGDGLRCSGILTSVITPKPEPTFTPVVSLCEQCTKSSCSYSSTCVTNCPNCRDKFCYECSLMKSSTLVYPDPACVACKELCGNYQPATGCLAKTTPVFTPTAKY